MKIQLLPSIILIALSAPALADDYPQWLGPQRDGIWRETGVVDALPKDGPKVRWRIPIGAGYSGPAVANGKVFLTDRVIKPGIAAPKDPFEKRTLPGIERIHCINEADGQIIWTREYDCPYSLSYSAGPRATPIVDGNRLYTYGTEGHLTCLSLDGQIIWQKRISSDSAPTPIWGFAAHPLIDGDKLIALTNGKDATVTAFNKNTGEKIWSALSTSKNDPGYAPPMIYEAGGKRQLIIFHPEAINSLDPETGQVYWTQPIGPVQNGVAIVTPMKINDLLFITSAHDGGLMLRFDPSEPKVSVAWQRAHEKGKRATDAPHVIMAPTIMFDGHLYLVHAGGELRCYEPGTGKMLWETLDATNGNGEFMKWYTAFLTPNPSANRFFIANDSGELIVADVSPKGYKEISRTKVLEPVNKDAGRPVVWSHPAYANRSMYWRNDKELVCVSLAADKNG